MAFRKFHRRLDLNDFSGHTISHPVVLDPAFTRLKSYIWPKSPITEVRRWSDAVVLYVQVPMTGCDKFYVLRDSLEDPLFWNQPLNKAWINELKEILVKQGIE